MIENSNMFRKLKSLFVVEEAANDTGTVSEQNTQPGNPESSTPVSTINHTISTEQTNASPSPKFTDLLLRAIEAGNIDGFDYLEYKNSIKSLQNVIPDEGMRYKSAFEMAKTMGLSKEKLIHSANHYLNLLATEDKKFKDALENQKAKQIQGRTDQMKAIEQAVKEKQLTIEKLTSEIAAADKQLSDVKNEINDAVVKIDVTNQQFVASYQIVFGQINEDIEKIKSNI
ncbi:MAG: hypothetical protein H7X99_07590 [Saprospiraceae bacterium]|nr:hypothetical protein [Saprospiraceae bacterium]